MASLENGPDEQFQIYDELLTKESDIPEKPGSQVDNPVNCETNLSQEKKKKNLSELLNEQFDNPLEISLKDGSTMKIVDLKPEAELLAKGEEIQNTPVILIQGLGQDARQFRENMIRLAEKGWRVLAVNQVYGIDPKNLSAAAQEQLPDIDEVERRKVATLNKMMEVMKTMGISQVNAITHSEGAIVLAEAAKKNSKFFRNVIMVEPAGISKSKTDNPWVAAGILSVSGALDTALEKVRIEKGALENKAKKYAAEHEIEAPEILSQIDRQLGIKERLAALEAKLGLKTPKNFDPERARQNAAIGKENAAISAKADFRRIISAIPVIARYQIGETMVELRKKGIKIVIFQGVDDQFFDARSVMENLPKGSYDNVVSIGGTHGQVSLQAEAHSDAFSDTFKSLEWKRTREGSGRIVPFEKSHKEQKQIHPDQDIKVLYRPKKKRSGISA